MNTPTTISAREFNQDPAGAKKAAKHGPVFITDRGQHTHVLLSVEQYRELVGQQANIADLLGMDEAAEIQFDPPRAEGLFRPASFD